MPRKPSQEERGTKGPLAGDADGDAEMEGEGGGVGSKRASVSGFDDEGPAYPMIQSLLEVEDEEMMAAICAN